MYFRLGIYFTRPQFLLATLSQFFHLPHYIDNWISPSTRLNPAVVKPYRAENPHFILSLQTMNYVANMTSLEPF